MIAEATGVAAWTAEFSAAEGRLPGARDAGVRGLRREALARFEEVGFPTPRLEEWKKTSVAPIARTAFRPARALDGAADATRLAQLVARAAPGAGPRLVFVNGRLAAGLSSSAGAPSGLAFGSLATALESADGAAAARLARHAAFADPAQAFTALNTALFADGAWIGIPAGAVLERPLHVVWIAAPGEEPEAAHPRMLALVGAGARATVVEAFLTLGSGAGLTNAVSEIVLEDNAALDHVRVQDESESAFHVGRVHARLGRDSVFASHVVALGASLARVDVDAVLAAPGAECSLNGLYLARGAQHVDHHTAIDHASPHCTSRELYHGVIDGRAHAVFHGKIVVRPAAQKTDAYQVNKNLLLSDDAIVDTKPQLEIFANDVKCKHGATVGQLPEDVIFYLRSRGLDRDTARHLLTHAFAGAVLGRIGPATVRAEIDALVTARLSGNGERA